MGCCNSSSAETDAPPALYEESDCLACAMGARSMLPPAYQVFKMSTIKWNWHSCIFSLLVHPINAG